MNLDSFLAIYPPNIILSDTNTSLTVNNIEKIEAFKPNLLGEHEESECFHLTLFFKNGDGPLELFAKNLPSSSSSPGLRKILLESKLIEREANFYNELLPAIKIFCEQNCKYKFLSIYPRCYFASAQSILMENLDKKGFQLLDKMKRLNFEEAKFALKALSKLHAVTYLMLNKMEMSEFREKFDCVQESFYYNHRKDFMKKFSEPSFSAGIKLLQIKNDEDCQRLLLKLAKYDGQIFETFCKLIYDTEHLCLVVNHGDFWSSNILYKFKDGNKNEIDEIKLIDFAEMRITSPNIDIANFLFSSVKFEIRKLHWKKLLQIYFGEFCQNVFILNGKVSFNFEDFLNDFKSKSFFGFINGFTSIVDMEAKCHYDFEASEDIAEDFGKVISDWIENNPEFHEKIISELINIFDDYEKLINS